MANLILTFDANTHAGASVNMAFGGSNPGGESPVRPPATLVQQVFARRQGRDWYVGAMTNWTPRHLDIPLQALGKGAGASSQIEILI